MASSKLQYKKMALEELIVLSQKNDLKALEELLRREQKNIYTAFTYLDKKRENHSIDIGKTVEITIEKRT